MATAKLYALRKGLKTYGVVRRIFREGQTYTESELGKDKDAVVDDDPVFVQVGVQTGATEESQAGAKTSVTV